MHSLAVWNGWRHPAGIAARLAGVIACGALVLAFSGCSSGSKYRQDFEAWERLHDAKLEASQVPRPRTEELPPEVLVQEGKANLAARNYGVAEFYFSAALKKSPDSLDALQGLGESQWAQGRFEPAEASFQRVLTLDPGHSVALGRMGAMCRKRGETERALDYLSEAVEISPEDPHLLEELALTYESAERFGEAEPLFRLVLEKQPSTHAYNNLGFNLLSQKRYEEAVAPLEQAVRLGGNDPRPLNNLAVAYAMTGRDNDAFELFADTVGRAAAYNNLGYLQMIQGKWVDAESSFRSAMEASPSYYTKARQNLDRLGKLIYEQTKDDLDGLKAQHVNQSKP